MRWITMMSWWWRVGYMEVPDTPMTMPRKVNTSTTATSTKVSI